MGGIPIAMPIEEILVGVDQERARAAGRIEDAELGRLFWRLSLDELPDRLPDDVIHDISRRVIDAAGLLDLGLVLDDGVMPGRQPDDLAQELLVNLAEDVGRNDREFVGALGIIKPFEELTQEFVVHVEAEGQLVGRLVAVLLGLEIKKP